MMLVMLVLPLRSVHAQTSREYQIKATFLYHFLQFVEWPDSAFGDTPDRIVVAVLGDDPFGPVLERTLTGKTAQGKTLVIRRFASPEEVTNCHLLFVGPSMEDRLPNILHSLDHGQVLTVGEAARFTQHGGIIKLFEFKNKIRFEINLEAAQRAGLKVSSKLLRLAKLTT